GVGALNFAAIELHEDEIPKLCNRIARAIDVGGAVLSVIRIVAHVVMDFAAWPAWPSLAHLPEIIFPAETQNALTRRTDLLPEFLSVFVRADFAVAFEHAEPHARRIELVFIDQQVPRKLDCIFFEIIAEGKIAEHLKESLVT